MSNFHNYSVLASLDGNEKARYIDEHGWGNGCLLIERSLIQLKNGCTELNSTETGFPIIKPDDRKVLNKEENSKIYPTCADSWIAQGSEKKLKIQPELCLVVFAKGLFLFEQRGESVNIQKCQEKSAGKKVYYDKFVLQQLKAFVKNGYSLLVVNDSHVDKDMFSSLFTELANPHRVKYMQRPTNSIEDNLKVLQEYLLKNGDCRLNMVFHCYETAQIEHAFSINLFGKSTFPQIARSS